MSSIAPLPDTDLVPAIIARHGGKVLARGGMFRIREGRDTFRRFIVIESPPSRKGTNMVEYVIPAPQIPSLAVEGTNARFPVGRIFCVGRNYAEHAREMGHDPNREPPFFFMKPGTAILEGKDFPYPSQTKDVHHEMELVVAIGKGGANIPESKALEHVYGYAVGLDMTRRDAGRAKKGRRGTPRRSPLGAVRLIVPAADQPHEGRWSSKSTARSSRGRPRRADLEDPGDDRSVGFRAERAI
jgi:2-keto-4-pentenoate hydratase/2-oxohepta-3-ene-1,7-dioic acid hydratase in catechol pathway